MASALFALSLLASATFVASSSSSPSSGTIQTFTITRTEWSTVTSCPVATISLCAASCNAAPYTLGVDVNYATLDNTITTATSTRYVVPLPSQEASNGLESAPNDMNDGGSGKTITVIDGKTITIFEGTTTTLTAGAVYTTNVVYPTSVACSAGETVIIDEETIIVTQATTIYDCPCTKATTLTVGGIYTTNVVYPNSVTCSGGETIILSETTTVVPGPTVISNCPCTKPTTFYVPGPTTTLPGTTITGGSSSNFSRNSGSPSGATVSDTTSGFSAVSSHAATSGSPPSGTVNGSTSYQTAINGIKFLVQKGVNYNGITLKIAAKRQAATTLSTCLDTCAGVSLCVATSYNTGTSSCLYFSGIDQSSRHAEGEIFFAIATSRLAVQSSSAQSTASSSSEFSDPSSAASSTSRTSSVASESNGPSMTASMSSSASLTNASTSASSTQSALGSSTSTLR